MLVASRSVDFESTESAATVGGGKLLGEPIKLLRARDLIRYHVVGAKDCRSWRDDVPRRRSEICCPLQSESGHVGRPTQDNVAAGGDNSQLGWSSGDG